MSADLIAKTAEAAGNWWAERLDPQLDAKRETFAVEVAARVDAALRRHPHVYTECDYDPKGLLLEAVRAVGIECGGFMFSARGILPQKHELEIKPGVLSPKEGYGNWTDDIVVEAGSEGEAEAPGGTR